MAEYLRPAALRRLACRYLAVLALAAGASGWAAAAVPTVESVAEAIGSGGDPAQVAAGLPPAALDDVVFLNRVRLQLKAQGRAPAAQRLLDELAKRQRSEAVLYNLSLAYVDQMLGRNLLQQGYLSTASVRTIDEILAKRPGDWQALYIRGLNNLYWPDWFGKAKPAQADLALAVKAGQPQLATRADEDGQAWSYLALGDALALLDRSDEARAAWSEGARLYPYFPSFAARLALTDAERHRAVRAARNADKPIDTDLERLRGVAAPARTIKLTGGDLYGPGPLPDQRLVPGGLHDLKLARPLTGTIAQANNGGAEPNLPGEAAVGKTPNGRFSDGTPVNENIDVGHVLLMNGKLKLFLAALAGGPNGGNVHFYLDRYWNWTIRDDIGIDPGFAEGVIKFDEFTFSTSPRLLPLSTQTQNKEPAGVDRAGSLASGAVVPGLLGDDDGDGKLDGTFNALGSFPLGAVFLPGAPFAQTRFFTTDIDVSAELAGFLTLANAVSQLRALEAARAAGTAAAPLEEVARDRYRRAAGHFARADSWVRSLDPKAAAAYRRLLAPASALPAGEVRARYVCGAEADLALLAAALGLIANPTDGSRLAVQIKCTTS